MPAINFEGKNCINEIIECIFEQQNYCNQIVNNHFNKKLKMTTECENNYQNSNDCSICNQKIKYKDKVRDHCHITGKYRGAAHSKCNLKLRIPKKCQLFFII